MPFKDHALEYPQASSLLNNADLSKISVSHLLHRVLYEDQVDFLKGKDFVNFKTIHTCKV